MDRANNTVDVWTQDASNLPRPAKIEGRVGTATGTVQWSTGQYVFDGSGNLVRLGTGYALHDAVSRVTSGAFSLGLTSNGTPTATWSTTYDGFGNIQSIATATSRNTPTSSSTNRLTGSVTYDGAGNMTSWNGASYKYDALDRTWSITNGTQDWRHMYTVDGERVFSFSASGGPSRWTLRDLDGRVLRGYENAGGTWSVVKDYVYRGSHAVAAYTRDASPQNLTHLHTDHLGTVRAVTDANGTRIAYHVFYPFGEEATAISQSTERLKFTGHERDLGNTGSAADDIDYMHARYYNAQIGRFLGVDPVNSAEIKSPQTWVKFVYSRNNPLARFDPDGRADRRTGQDLEATERPVVLTLAVSLADSTTTNFEYGGVIGLSPDGTYVTAGPYTSQRPHEVSQSPGVETTAQGEVVVKGTNASPVYTMHTHLADGVNYPVPGTTKVFTATDASSPSEGDRNAARATGTPGLIVVPSERLLIKVSANGSSIVLLSKKDYDAWIERGRKNAPPAH